MTLENVNQLLKQAAHLSPLERLEIARRLLEELQKDIPIQPQTSLKWADLCGLLPYPAYGEDAQRYISRTRNESSLQRSHISENS